jgi:hypothetical protein
VKIGVAFTEPGEWYVITEVIACNKFYFVHHGGATVPTYGPLMKLMLNNEGSTPVKVTRLAYYAAR